MRELYGLGSVVLIGTMLVPPGVCAAERVDISQIQGAAHTSPLVGRTVVTDGVVTAIAGGGFYLQDPQGDGDPATSDAIFVSRKPSADIRPGASVEVEGRVTEASTRPGAPAAELTVTEIDGAVVRRIGSSEVPAPAVIGNTGRQPPTEVIEDDGLTVFDPNTDGLDFWESLEGMLVRVNDAVVVGPTNGFRETWVVGDGGPAATGMNRDGGITLAPGDFNPERIQLQAVTGLIGNPEIRLAVGDRIDHAVGVESYAFGNYEVVLTELGTVTAAARSPIRTQLSKAPDRLLIGSYNVENLDPKLEAADRVANPRADIDDDVGRGRFTAIAGQVVEALGAPDILALQEIQDDDGAELSDVVSADATLSLLVEAIAQAGGPSYRFVYRSPVDDAEGGQPGGNIRVAFLFDPARVQLAEDRVERIAGAAFADNRLPLAAPFRFNGAEVLMINLHLTSKGGSDPLFGSVQPPTDGGREQRVAQAQAVRRYLQSLPADPARRLMVLGDMNAYQFEPPPLVLADGGMPQLINLTNAEPLPERRSYVFEGNGQALDHVLVDTRSAAGAEHEALHLNSGLPENLDSGPAVQISDHDPTVVSLKISQ